jgi:hypothetical protein
MPSQSKLPSDITVNIIFGILATLLAIIAIWATITHGNRSIGSYHIGSDISTGQWPRHSLFDVTKVTMKCVLSRSWCQCPGLRRSACENGDILPQRITPSSSVHETGRIRPSQEYYSKQLRDKLRNVSSICVNKIISWSEAVVSKGVRTRKEWRPASVGSSDLLISAATLKAPFSEVIEGEALGKRTVRVAEQYL